MRTSSHEVAWVAAMLEDLPDIDVLRISVDADTIEISPNGRRLAVVDLDIHAGSWADALVLAKALRLREVPGRTTESQRYGVSVWRRWAGWAAEASHEVPVWIEVTAAELERDIPTLFEVA